MRLVLPEAQLKASQTKTGTRVLDFYAGTWDVDSRGDQIQPTAFDSWLKSFYAHGDPLPISFAHAAVLDSTDPAAIIGFASADADHVWVDDFGLRIKATLYADNDKAAQVARLIDDGVVKSASVAMMIDDWTSSPSDVREITKASVKEAGPCMFPVNDAAVLLSLKASLAEGWLSAEQFQDLFGADLKSVEGSELEAYMSENPGTTEGIDDILVKASPEYVQSTHDAALRAGAVCEHEVPAEVVEIKAEETEELTAEQREALVKAEQVLEEATPLLSDEDREIQRRFRYLEITNGK